MNQEEKIPICDYEGSDYQQSFWDTGQRAYEDRVEAIALKRLLPPTGDILLEIGAGAGRNSPRYKGFRKIVLLDYSVSQLKLAQQRLGNEAQYLYVAGDAYHLPFMSGVFDAATMIRTLHHLKEAPLALKETRRILKKEGIFILEYANKQNIKAIFRYYFGKQKWNPFDNQAVEFAPLNYDFHPKAIRDWVEHGGFRIQKQLTVSHFRIGVLKRWIPLNLLVWLDSLVQGTGDWWQLSPSVFLRAKAVGESRARDEGAFFACPQCGNALYEENNQAMICSSCGSIWEIKEGIYIFK